MQTTSTQEREQFGRRHKIVRHDQQASNADRRLRIPSIRGDLALAGYHDDDPSGTQSLKIKIGEYAFSSTWADSNTKAPRHCNEDVQSQDSLSRGAYRANSDGAQCDFSDTQNMLEDESFHGFSDRPSHLRGHSSRPSTAQRYDTPNELVNPQQPDSVRGEVGELPSPQQ